MSKFEYMIEDFSFANYNRVAIKIFNSAETNKEAVLQIILEAVRNFFLENNEISKFKAKKTNCILRNFSNSYDL